MNPSPFDSSMEELSPEELRMLASMKRQEPQGEEHSAAKFTCVSTTVHPTDVNSMETYSSGSSSSTPDTSEAEDGHSGNTGDPRSRRRRHPVSKKQPQFTSQNNASTDSTNSHSAYNTLIIHQNNSSLLADTWIPATHEFTAYRRQHEQGDQQRSVPYDNVLVDDGSNNNSALTSSELSEIPRDYLNQLTVLKHLAKEVKQDPISGSSTSSLLRSASFSKSQPDLTEPGVRSGHMSKFEEVPISKTQPQPSARKKKPIGSVSVAEGDMLSQSFQDEVTPSVQILEILMRENDALNTELVNARRKIATIHKLETELDRLQASHEALFASAERRESLERTARAKLNTELKRLTAVNRELLSSGSLQNLSPQPYSTGSTTDLELLRKEIAKRDFTIQQILLQNKELTNVKERQEIELCAQHATLTEQRTHIEILDSALTNAQANVLRLEEECRQKQEFVDKSSQLQRALSSLQLTQDKREQSEKKVRTQLEGEISDLKLRLASLNVPTRNSSALAQTAQRGYQSPPYTPPKYESNTNLTEGQMQLLQEKLKVSEEQIYHLNAQVAKWENVFTPHSSACKGGPPGRSGASVSTPDTPNSWTHSNSRGGTPHFFGGDGSTSDLGGGSSGGRGLEWKVKDLETRLMEKDAMIRILQTVPSASPTPIYYRDTPGYSQVMSSSHPTSASLSMMTDTPATLYAKGLKSESEPPSYANLPLKLRLGGSGSSLVKNSNESLQLGSGSNTGGNSPNISGPGSVTSMSGGGAGTPRSIDEQLKDLDNQLLSKGSGAGGGGPNTMPSDSLKPLSGLCCLPGFPNPSVATRKGKIPQSLLESITVGSVVLGQPNPFGRKGTVLPPKPPSSQSSHDPMSRTSSGPPFVSESDQSPMLAPLVSSTTALLSSSVDSILADPPNRTGSTYVFTPASPCPTGLPPKPSSVDTQAAKSRSLERNKYINPNEHSVSKYSSIMYDSSRCRSLDRREMKVATVPVPATTKPEKVEDDKKKSSVTSKAAFFGQLLSRRSPSPGRDKEKKESTPKMGRRFPFGSKSSNPAATQQSAEERLLLDKQGRQSQRSRISSKWNSCNTLEAVDEQSGTESPFVSRKIKGSPKLSKKMLQAQSRDPGLPSQSEVAGGESTGKKWGRIVKTPFGLRYTFGSPRVAAPMSEKGENRS